jgi:hypothetical protein
VELNKLNNPMETGIKIIVVGFILFFLVNLLAPLLMWLAAGIGYLIGVLILGGITLAGIYGLGYGVNKIKEYFTQWEERQWHHTSSRAKSENGTDQTD